MTKTQAEYLRLYTAGLTMTEIATIKRINVSTVSRTLHRAHISKLKAPPTEKQMPFVCAAALSCHVCPNKAACDSESVHIRTIPPDPELQHGGRYSY